jgi:hypothetical protein
VLHLSILPGFTLEIAQIIEKLTVPMNTGNVDYLEWSQNKHINFVRDTDKVMDAFYHFCHKAGPKTCAFHAESPTAIKTRLNNLLDTIKVKPITVPVDILSGPQIPQFITWSRVKRLTVSVLYQPLRMFPQYAQVLAALEGGDGKPFYDLILPGSGAAPFCPIETMPPNYPRLEPVNQEATSSIQCSDRPTNHDTLETFNEYTKTIMELSEAAGDVSAGSRLMCAGRTVRSNWEFAGTLGHLVSHSLNSY